jgi:HPr kinase/phosphorylase
MPEPPANRTKITVEKFMDAASGPMRLSVLAGNEVLADHRLDSPRVQKLGLALSGFTHRIHRGRIQIFGNSEAQYFRTLDASEGQAAVDRLDSSCISCIIVTAGNRAPEGILEFAKSKHIPLLATPIPSSEAINCIADILGYELAPVATVHGVLMEVFGVGVLISGESGIGKSECALDLIGRGHRLVSDDAVLMRRIGERLTGEAPDVIRDHLEIRGLGIINARELFGVSVLAEKTHIQLCIEFIGEDAVHESDRLGIETERAEILGLELPRYVLPVRPGRNLATLAETAVRVFVSRTTGLGSADGLIARHDNALGKP